ncbi:hypothetical protein BHM03_00018616 [Ensete ventricosum]|uniref:Uncharacterized protein n=1 Tax=Ensete ventricosum TaxID=4639 RepID=A0A445MF81_ENSVE|nr:hypothetical protein BHM03_00018616 [Ensete ventricosum]
MAPGHSHQRPDHLGLASHLTFLRSTFSILSLGDRIRLAAELACVMQPSELRSNSLYLHRTASAKVIAQEKVGDVNLNPT